MTDTEKEEYIKKYDVRLVQNKHGKYNVVHGRLALIGKPKGSDDKQKVVARANRRVR